MNLRTKALAISAALTAAVATVGIAEQDSPDRREAGRAVQPAAGARDVAQGNFAQYEPMFLKSEASSNIFEVSLAQHVAQQTQDSQIKQAAQLIIDDHTKAQQQLRQAAKQAGVEINDELMDHHQATLKMFKQKQGAMLEKSFVWHNVGDHHKKVLMYQFWAQNAQNPAVKQYASATLPNLQKHLAHVERLAGGGARTVGGEAGGHDGHGTTDRDRNQPNAAGGTTPNSSNTGAAGTGAGGTSTGDRRND